MLSKSFVRWTLPISMLYVAVLGRELVPIHPSSGPGHQKRDHTELDLKSQQTFLWGESDGGESAVANLTVFMPGESENILAMERFDGMLTDIECNTNNLALTFEDDATFAYAQRVWDWVNGADNHSFVMVAGVGNCGNNTQRIPFTISTLSYDETANKAVLSATKTSFTAIAHSYDLLVGSVAQPGVARRAIKKATTIDFVHDLPFSVALSANGLEGRLACTNCSTTGQFDMEFKISQKLLIPTGASMKLSPRGVSAIAQIKLSGTGSLTDALTKEFDILSIPISGIKIPGVLDLGPFLTVSVGAELSAISLTAGIQTGATAKLDDAALLEVDLLHPEQNSFSGWEPIVDAVDVKVDASISGGVAVFLKPALELKAEALGHGFALGLNMKIPNVKAQLSAIASPQGACPKEEGKAQTGLGVKAAINIGAALNIQAKKEKGDDPLFTIQIAAIDKPLASVCFPFGPEIAARSLLNRAAEEHISCRTCKATKEVNRHR